jgi:hypothetical protein
VRFAAAFSAAADGSKSGFIELPAERPLPSANLPLKPA